MYAKLLTAAAIASSLPAATNAIYDPSADYSTPAEQGAPHKPTLLILNVGDQPAEKEEASIASSDGGEMTITTLMVPEDGEEVTPPGEGEVAITMVPEDGGDVAPSADGEVSITNIDVSVIAVDSPLVGPTWTAVKYYDAPANALVDVLQSTTITLEFEDDGRLDGNGGCNNYFTGYSDLSDSSFAVAGPMGSTMMMCEENIMAQEMSYFNIFEGAINWSISDNGRSLELTDADTKNVIAQYALFTPLIIGPEWTATKYYGSNGLVDVLPDTTITLTMEIDERFDGSAGCNSYIGSYDDLTASSFMIDGPVGSTKMLCDDTDLEDQEYAYLQNFEDGRKVEWAVVADGSLELRDANTDELFAVYTAGLEGSADPLSNSGSMTLRTAVAAFAMLAVTIFV